MTTEIIAKLETILEDVIQEAWGDDYEIEQVCVDSLQVGSTILPDGRYQTYVEVYYLHGGVSEGRLGHVTWRFDEGAVYDVETDATPFDLTTEG